MSLEPGGRPGGEIKFLIGALLTGIGLWLFFDSVRVTTGHYGLLSGAFGRGGRGLGQTTSMGILLVPLFIGIVALFFNVRQTWAWVVTVLGFLIIAVEIVSRLRPHFDMKASHGILMLIIIAGGIGLMLKGYIDDRRANPNG